MKHYAGRFIVVAVIFLLSIGVGALVTQEGGRVPLRAEQLAAISGIYEFDWSPDGKSIAYLTSQAGSSDLWRIPASGGTPLRLTSTSFLKKQPRWSRDGKWIAYVALSGDNAGSIEIVSPDGKTTLPLTEAVADAAEPTWSPDSRYIAFTERSGGRYRLLSLDIQSRELRRLVDIQASALAWSPDGMSIAFVSNPLLPGDYRRDNQDIFIVPATGGVPRLITPATPRFRDTSPTWSPDSRHLSYVSETSTDSNVYVVDVQTGDRRRLTAENAVHLAPKWSPDGRSIAYLRNDAFQFQLFVSPADQWQPLRVSDKEGVNGGFEDGETNPQGSFRWAPDSKRLAFIHSDPSRVSDIWVGEAGAHPLQLTNSMPPELRREARFVWPELIRYRSFDGEEIAAFVYKPRAQKPKTGHPALLAFRDTVEGQHALEWDPIVQYFVSSGYVVFAPNVRGSSGQGKDYRQLVFGNGGDQDVRDAFFGLDRLSSEGLIDNRRLGVYGAGTGGFLTTAALVKDQDRFKAAVNLYGIVDTVTASSYPSMEAWSRYMIGAGPMEAPLAFYDRSLVNFVDKLHTPIIFLYPGGSASAPLQQLQQFAVQAEVKGKWFDYHVFEIESGNWRHWRPLNIRMTLEAMDALFEKYLLGKDRDVHLSRSR